jgi:hypothetical protein
MAGVGHHVEKIAIEDGCERPSMFHDVLAVLQARAIWGNIVRAVNFEGEVRRIVPARIPTPEKQTKHA